MHSTYPFNQPKYIQKCLETPGALLPSLRISQFSWNDFTRTFVHVYIAYGCVAYRRAVMEAAVSTYRSEGTSI